MLLENIVVDSTDPGRHGRFWEAALATAPLTDHEDVYETRLEIPGGPTLDLCFPRVGSAPAATGRLHLDLAGGPDPAERLARLRGLGAQDLDIGQEDVPWTVLADPAGHAFCQMPTHPRDPSTGPIAALPLDSADPVRDADFWEYISGWTARPDLPDTAPGAVALRHPSDRGPVLLLCPEPEAKGAHKNPIHLDVRLESGEDVEQVTAEIVARGGTRIQLERTDLPWRIFTDPSGNEFCVLPATPTPESPA